MGAQKMSKTLGNVLSIHNIQERGIHPLDVRYYLLSVHYRTKLKFSWRGLEDAHKARRRITEWMEELKCVHREGRYGSCHDETPEQAMRTFQDAMNSDLNTPKALGVVFEALNVYYARAPFNEVTHRRFIDLIEKVRFTFGCFEEEEVSSTGEVVLLLKKREDLRNKKDFSSADLVRVQIEQMGFEVLDTKEGTKVRKVLKGGQK